MKINEYQDSYKNEWDNFVRNHPEGRFVQLSGFKDLVENTFGFLPCYWFFKKENNILAVFSGFCSGKRLISQPFSEYGGFLVKAGLPEGELKEVLNLFSSRIKEYLVEKKLEVLEIHNGLELPQELLDKYFKKILLYKYAVLELDSPNILWQEKMNYEVRKAINKAKSNRFEIQRGISQAIIREKFYPLYLISMKRLGSPPHSLAYFLNGYQYLGGSVEFFWAELNGKPIAGLLGWKSGQRVQITDTVSDSKLWQTRVNDLLHWEFIKWAADHGFKHFDFGPVRYQGQEKYKRKWGCQFFDYYYYYLPKDEKQVFKKPLDDSHCLIKILSFFWRKAIPLKLTPWFGKYIRKRLGK